MPEPALLAGQGSGTGLGIDAGGTATRWALATPAGQILAEGAMPGLSALQLQSEHGRAALRASFGALAATVLPHGAPARVCAGLTGFTGSSGFSGPSGVTGSSPVGGDAELLQRWLAEPLHLAPQAIHFCSDMEIAYRAAFAPGAGYLVYAGTGSIGAFIDAEGHFQRAGGRGVVLDDGGGGFWIAREALRTIWRNEDERPGAWRASPMAQAVFDHVGGADWAYSRQFIYGQERGAVGKLALAVAASAERDPAALAILEGAGRELARLAQALIDRYGVRPVAVSGRAAGLHPAIFAAMHGALVPDPALMPDHALVPDHALAPAIVLTRAAGAAHHAAARMAATPFDNKNTDKP